MCGAGSLCQRSLAGGVSARRGCLLVVAGQEDLWERHQGGAGQLGRAAS